MSGTPDTVQADLIRCVDTFRVQELQEVLSFSGQPKVGKKLELKLRVQGLIRQGPTHAITAKISEIYTRKHPGWTGMNGGGRTVVGAATGTNATGRNASNLNFLSLLSDLGFPSTSHSHPRPAHINNHAIFSGNDAISRRVVAAAPPPSHTSHTAMGGSRLHQRGISTFTSSTPSLLTNGHSSTPQTSGALTAPTRNPTNVQKVRLPFFDVLETVVPVSALLPNSRNLEGMQDHIHMVDIAKTKAARFLPDLQKFSDDAGLPRVELQLRFFRFDPSTAQKEDFPSKAVVRLDAHMVQLPATIPTNKPNVEPKRPSRPVDITGTSHNFLFPRPRPFKLMISWAQKPDAYHVYTVEVVRRLSAEILVKRLENKGERPPEVMKRMVAEKLRQDQDDLLTDSLRVSLMCPLGMMRITLPGKTTACTHPACFDLRIFLAMNEKKPTWTCPCCHKPAHFDDLIIEGFFADLLRDSGTRDAVEVELFADGTYRGISEDEKDGKVPKKEAKASPAPSAVSGRTSSAPSTSTTKAVEIEEEPDIITLSDSDDEAPAPKGISVRKTSAQFPHPIVFPSHNGSAVISMSSSVDSSPESPGIIVLDSPSSFSQPSPQPQTSRPQQAAGGQRRPSPPMSRSPPKKRFAGNNNSPRPGSSGPPTPSLLPPPLFQGGQPGAMSHAGLYMPTTSGPAVSSGGGGYGWGQQEQMAAFYQGFSGLPGGLPASLYPPLVHPNAGSPLPPNSAPPEAAWMDNGAVDAEFQRFLSMCQTHNGMSGL